MYKCRLLKDRPRPLHLDTRQRMEQRRQEVRMVMLTPNRIHITSSVIGKSSSISSKSSGTSGIVRINVEFSLKDAFIIWRERNWSILMAHFSPVCLPACGWLHRPWSPCPQCKISPLLSGARSSCRGPVAWSPPCPRPPRSSPRHPPQPRRSTRPGAGRVDRGPDTLNTDKQNSYVTHVQLSSLSLRTWL